jgi:hypothetical protein
MLAALLAQPKSGGGGPQWSDLRPAHPNYYRRDDVDEYLDEQEEIDEERDEPAPKVAKKAGRRRIKPGKSVQRPGDGLLKTSAPAGDVLPTEPTPGAPFEQALLHRLQEKAWEDRRAEILAQAAAYKQRQRDDEEALMMILLSLE